MCNLDGIVFVERRLVLRYKDASINNEIGVDFVKKKKGREHGIGRRHGAFE